MSILGVCLLLMALIWVVLWVCTGGFRRLRFKWLFLTGVIITLVAVLLVARGFYWWAGTPMVIGCFLALPSLLLQGGGGGGGGGGGDCGAGGCGGDGGCGGGCGGCGGGGE